MGVFSPSLAPCSSHQIFQFLFVIYFCCQSYLYSDTPEIIRHILEISCIHPPVDTCWHLLTPVDTCGHLCTRLTTSAVTSCFLWRHPSRLCLRRHLWIRRQRSNVKYQKESYAAFLFWVFSIYGANQWSVLYRVIKIMLVLYITKTVEYFNSLPWITFPWINFYKIYIVIFIAYKME